MRWACIAALLCATGLACSRELPLPQVDAVTDAFATIAAPPSERVAAGDAKRGVGWYPNVRVDAQDRVHFAWTDADVGDVYYAVSAPNASTPQHVELVDAQGAAGGYVRLALAPGGTPIISYVHQDERTLRVAHRPADVATMGAAGAQVDLAPLDATQAQARAKGWVTEEVAFGDEIGTAATLHVDAAGRPHVLYYARGDRLRYAGRPADRPAFGAGGVGHWERQDVDDNAGQSPILRTALSTLPDGTVVAAYANWQVVHSHLRLAARPPGAKTFTVSAAVQPARAGIEGAWVGLFVDGDAMTVLSTRMDDGAVWLGQTSAHAPAPIEDRTKLAPAHGATAFARGAGGTWWMLTRDPQPLGDGAAGLYLVEVRSGDPKQARRTLLERGTQDDPWLDVAVRANGAPVAVWFSEDSKSLRSYAP